MISIEGQIVDDREMAARPPMTISTESCLYDAPSATLYGYLYSIDHDVGVTYPEWIAIESHITGARYILGIDYSLVEGLSIDGPDGIPYVFKREDVHPFLKRFILFKTHERMINSFKEAIKG